MQPFKMLYMRSNPPAETNKTVVWCIFLFTFPFHRELWCVPFLHSLAGFAGSSKIKRASVAGVTIDLFLISCASYATTAPCTMQHAMHMLFGRNGDGVFWILTMFFPFMLLFSYYSSRHIKGVRTHPDTSIRSLGIAYERGSSPDSNEIPAYRCKTVQKRPTPLMMLINWG